MIASQGLKIGPVGLEPSVAGLEIGDKLRENMKKPVSLHSSLEATVTDKKIPRPKTNPCLNIPINV